MNQYWLLLRPVLVTTRSSTGHYQRPVLVRSLTSTGLFYPSQESHTPLSVRALCPNTIIPVRRQAPHGDNHIIEEKLTISDLPAPLHASSSNATGRDAIAKSFISLPSI